MALTSAALVNIDWVYCGTLMQLAPRVESFTKELLLRAPAVRLFYDMNLREGHWNLALVQRLSSLASVLKLNETEAHTLWRMTGKSLVPFDLEVFCAEWSMQHGIEVICITLGAEGCFVYHQGESYFLRGLAIQVQDTVGSGDAFAAGFLHQYHSGMPLREAAKFANALGALVATHSGATPSWQLPELDLLLASAGK
jgi:fructokinase